MNNSEKREFIDCLTLLDNGNCFPNELERRNSILRKCPKTFFKYRCFDKYTFEMISDCYAYLAPVKNLDDPFDCMSDFDISGMVSKNNSSINSKFLNYIIESVEYEFTDEQVKIIKKHVKPFINNGNIDIEEVQKVLDEVKKDDENIGDAITYIRNLLEVYKTYLSRNEFDELGQIAKKPDDILGVCSLSEINNNKVMWSLYGKKYKGYCIEYEIAPTNKAHRFLCPVIYTRRPNNNFSRKMFDSIFAQTKRNIIFDFSPCLKIERVGAIYELFCTKDIDWAYQKEWRIIGNAKKHFKDVKIKAIYLGFDVAKANEKKILNYSKEYKFNVYKMKAPDGKKRIRFTKLV